MVLLIFKNSKHENVTQFIAFTTPTHHVQIHELTTIAYLMEVHFLLQLPNLS